jgi:hypothetical protein
MKKSFFLYFALGVALLSACVKAAKPEPVGDVFIRAVNTVKGSNPQDFYQGPVKKSTSPISYGGTTGYLTLPSGPYQFAFADPGSGTANGASPYVNITIGTTATVFYARNLDSITVAYIFQDDVAPASVVGKAKVRFIHLNYYLYNSINVLNGETALLTGIPFAIASKYIEVDPGTKFTVTGTGVTTAPVIDGNLQANKNYTIWIDGTSAKELTGHVLSSN